MFENWWQERGGKEESKPFQIVVKEDVKAAWDYQQAKIDRLMLEYCPNEMTEAQLVEWESHQRPEI